MKSCSLCALHWRLLSWCNMRNIAQQARHIPERERDCSQAFLSQLDYLDRMVFPAGDFRPDLPTVAHTLSPSICLQVQQEIAPFCVSSPRQGSYGSGCFEPLMGGSGCLCITSKSIDSKCYKQDTQSRLLKNNSHSSKMGQNVVVLESSEPVIPDPPLPTTPNQSSNPNIQKNQSLQRPSQYESPCLSLNHQSPGLLWCSCRMN